MRMFRPCAFLGAATGDSSLSGMTTRCTRCHHLFAEILLKDGNEKITVDELVRALKPRGRMAVPDNIKAELLSKLRAAIVS